MNKVAIIGDGHFGVRNGDVQFLEFMCSWWERKIDEIKAKGINKIIQVGDLFDNRKMLDVRTAQTFEDRVIKKLCDLGMTMDILIGNHNIFYRDNNEVHNLFFLRRYDNIKIVQEFEDDGQILYLGWMNKNNTGSLLAAVDKSQARYCFGHLELNEFAMYKGIMATHGMDAGLFKKFHRVYTGHYHTISRAGNIVYTGSPYHLTWGDYPDGDHRGWFEVDLSTGDEIFHQNGPEDSLFRLFEYDPTKTYTEADLSHLAGTICRVIVKEKGDTRRYNKFISLLSAIKFIEFKLVDESLVVEKPQEEIDMDKVSVSIVNVLVDYTARLASTVPNASQDKIREMTVDIYNKATAR